MCFNLNKQKYVTIEHTHFFCALIIYLFNKKTAKKTSKKEDFETKKPVFYQKQNLNLIPFLF